MGPLKMTLLAVTDLSLSKTLDWVLLALKFVWWSYEIHIYSARAT